MRIFPTTLFGACFLALAATATAQWQSTTYALKGGWNAIYLHGDATYATPDELFASNPEVLEIWRWNPKPTQVQFTAIRSSRPRERPSGMSGIAHPVPGRSPA